MMLRGAVTLAWFLLPLVAAPATAQAEDWAAAGVIEVPATTYTGRRERLLERVQGEPVVVFAAPERMRNHEVTYPYRQSSNLHYLTGFPESQAVAVLELRSKRPFLTLFVQPRDPGQETWTGPLVGQEGAQQFYGANESFAIQELPGRLKRLLSGQRRIHYSTLDPGGDLAVLQAAAASSAELIDVHPLVGELRLIKDDLEIRLLQRAIDITVEAQKQAMRICAPGLFEFQLQAVIEYTYRTHGSPRIGFPSIVGSGPNSCVLHYETNDRRMHRGDMVVMDVGAEFGFYSADVTRTIPVNGTFSAEQAIVYDIVLAAQRAGIAEAHPGSTLKAISEAALRTLREGLKRHKILTQGSASPYTPHGISHWLGLDVHDECPYQIDRKPVELQPGMVLTIEPGLYFPAGDRRIDPRWWDIGIRIEDDILITPSGARVLSAAVPVEREAIEELMAIESALPFARHPE